MSATRDHVLEEDIAEEGRARSTKILPVAALGCAVGLLAALSPIASIGMALLVGVLILFKWWRDSVAVLAIAVIYSNAVVILAQRGTVPTAASALLLAALALVIMRDMVQNRSRPPALPGVPFVLLFAAMQCLSAIVSAVPEVAQAEFYSSLGEGILLFLLVGYAVRATGTLMSLVHALLFVGAVLGALSAIQNLTGDYTNTFFGFAGVSNASVPGGPESDENLQMRLNGNIGETNRYAQVLAVLLPLAAVRWATTSSVES